MDPHKIQVVLDWSLPNSLQSIRSFHGFASFYQRFINRFSTVIAPIIECLKGGVFKWNGEAQRSFELINKMVTKAPILTLPDFTKLFEVECDASNVGVGVVLSQENKPIAFLAKKLNDSWKNYSTYDKKFYAMVRDLDH